MRLRETVTRRANLAIVGVALLVGAAVGFRVLRSGHAHPIRHAAPSAPKSSVRTTRQPGVTSTTARVVPVVDPASVRANELGVIPVIMYHRIVPAATADTDRTPDQFRAELERLAADDYVPIKATQLVTGMIDVPAGKHPVVLTFDDGWPSQLTLDPTGVPTPDCAVGILLEVAKAHPGFRPTATFFVNRRPFGDATPTTLRWAVAHGFEIGNHTIHHVHLFRLSDAQAQREIASLQAMVEQVAPAATMHTIALPYGIRPRTEALALNGSANGIDYHYSGVFLVGAEPAPSPFSVRFDPLRVPRIRSDGGGGTTPLASSQWLDTLDAHPGMVYSSDGDPRVISFPASLRPRLVARFAAMAYPYPNLPPVPAPTTTITLNSVETTTVLPPTVVPTTALSTSVVPTNATAVTASASAPSVPT